MEVKEGTVKAHEVYRGEKQTLLKPKSTKLPPEVEGEDTDA